VLLPAMLVPNLHVHLTDIIPQEFVSKKQKYWQTKKCSTGIGTITNL